MTAEILEREEIREGVELLLYSEISTTTGRPRFVVEQQTAGKTDWFRVRNSYRSAHACFIDELNTARGWTRSNRRIDR